MPSSLSEGRSVRWKPYIGDYETSISDLCVDDDYFSLRLEAFETETSVYQDQEQDRCCLDQQQDL